MGPLFVLSCFVVFLVSALLRPWTGVMGYSFFVVLSPQWLWRWTLPDWNFQRYLAAATIIGILFNGLRAQKLQARDAWALVALIAVLCLHFVSSFDTISVRHTEFIMSNFWKVVFMACLTAAIVPRSKIRLFGLLLLVAQGWNAWEINRIYLELGWINVYDFRWGNGLDSNTYSIAMLPILAIGVAFIFNKTTRWEKCVAIWSVCLQLHAIMILESRGVMLGAVTMLMLAVLLMDKNRANLSLASVGLMVVLAMAGPSVIDEFSSAFAERDDRDDSAESRIHLWSAGWRIMTDNPILGVGPGGGQLLVPIYYEGSDMNVGKEKALHNLFLEVGTGAGIPAVILFGLFYAGPLLTRWRRRKTESSATGRLMGQAMLHGIPGFWIASMFSSGLLIESSYILVALGIASISGQRPSEDGSIAVDVSVTGETPVTGVADRSAVA